MEVVYRALVSANSPDIVENEANRKLKHVQALFPSYDIAIDFLPLSEWIEYLRDSWDNLGEAVIDDAQPED
jgi:hypothetical protein